MERLTYVTEDGEILFHPEDLPEDEGMTVRELAEGGRWKALDQIAGRLANIEQMEEQGLLVRLPCKFGDDVYIIPSPSVYGLNVLNGYEKNNRVYHQHVGSIVFTDKHWYMTTCEEYKIVNEKVLTDVAYGVTWFTDREEAEKKLKEMRNE